MNDILYVFQKCLNQISTPYNFKDICSYSFLQGFMLIFSVNARKGEYCGFFAKDENAFSSVNAFAFNDLNKILFSECYYFNNYITYHKVIVKVYFENGYYYLEMLEVDEHEEEKFNITITKKAKKLANLFRLMEKVYTPIENVKVKKKIYLQTV